MGTLTRLSEVKEEIPLTTEVGTDTSVGSTVAVLVLGVADAAGGPNTFILAMVGEASSGIGLLNAVGDFTETRVAYVI